MKEKRQRMSMGWPYSIYDSNFAASIIQAAAVGAVNNFPEISAIASVSCRYSPMIVPTQQKYFPYLFQRHLNLKLDSPEYEPPRSCLRTSNHCPSQPFLCQPIPVVGEFPSSSSSPVTGGCERVDTSCRCGIINCVSTNKSDSESSTPTSVSGVEKLKVNPFLYPPSNFSLEPPVMTSELKGEGDFLKNDIPYKSYFTP